MTRKFSIALLLFALTTLACVVPASAAISPTNVQRLKDECSDVVEITISEVTVKETVSEFFHSRTEVVYVAKVTAVKRSKSDVKVGDEIEFQSYFLKGAPPPGPRSPKLLAKGWKGSVFLKKTAEDKFKIGVFGHSFDAKKDSTK
ncbi:MAG: hypothetical protein ACI9HK_003365 [Pirellulaceae bacterium]|jgi:hypothetical protein